MRKAVERVVRVVFSPTGGTNSVANLLSAQIVEYDRQIDLTDAKLDFSREQVTPAEVAVIAAPSYGGRIPHLATQRLAQVRGNGARAVAFVQNIVPLKRSAVKIHAGQISRSAFPVCVAFRFARTARDVPTALSSGWRVS